MKATEYYEKYKNPIMDAYNREMNSNNPDECEVAHRDRIKCTADMIEVMIVEVKQIRMERRCISIKASESVVKEMNQRWNKICSLFEKEYGTSPITRNSFIENWKKLFNTYTL